MTELKYLVLREMLDQLRTFRFGVMCILILGVAVTGAVLAVKQDRQQRAAYDQARSQNHRELAERAESAWKFMAVFRKDTRFCRAPSLVPFIAGGGDRRLPNLFRVSAFGVKGPEYLRSRNPTLGYAEQIDWGFIGGVVLSLIALVLTFDAVSREREEKTFQMVMGNRIRRSTVIAGKALGAFLPIMAVWSVAVVLQSLLWNLLAVGTLGSREWGVVLLAGVPVALFVAFFVCLGIWISLLFNSSGACGTVAVLCWAFFVLVIPNAGQLLASRLEGTPDPKTAQARAEEAVGQIHRDLRREHGIELFNRYWSRPDPLTPHLKAEEAYDDEWRTVRDQWKRQARLGRRLSRFSPVTTLRCALEELADQGLPGYEAFERQAEKYRREIRATLLSTYPLGLNEPIRGEAVERMKAVPLPPESFPVPPSDEKSAGERLAAARTDIALLALFAGLGFVVTVATANRQSVTG